MILRRLRRFVVAAPFEVSGTAALARFFDRVGALFDW